MPRKGQRRPIRPEVTTAVRLFLSQLRVLADDTGLSDDALARELGIQPPQLSKLLSGAAIFCPHTKALHAVASRLASREVISLPSLLNLHDEAVFSAPDDYKKECTRARIRQQVQRESGSYLPVPRGTGDRQVGRPGSTTQAERFLATLLRDEGVPLHDTIDVLNAGADVLGPPEVAEVMASLQHRRESSLADDFARICGREQDKSSVIHAARDLIDPYGMPNLAARLLTAAILPHGAGEVS